MQGREKTLSDIGFEVVGKSLQKINREAQLKDRVWGDLCRRRKGETEDRLIIRLKRQKKEIEQEIGRIISYATKTTTKDTDRIVCRTLWKERSDALHSIDGYLSVLTQEELPF